MAREVKVTITGDAAGLSRAFGQAGNAAQSFGDRFSAFGTSMGRIGQVGALAFGGIAAGVGAIAGFGVKVAADAQQAQIGFETLLGSAEKAGAFMKELQAFAAKTPFEFPELRNAASRFVAVGVEASRVIPIMSAIGDATAAMGTGAVGIDRATTALTQMAQKGKVTAEEMMQLTEAGIPAWDALAAVLGTDVAGAMDQVSKGTVTAASMFEALETRAGPAMQRVAGMMDKQSQTLAGLFSTLKDTVGQSLATMMTPLVSSLTKAMPKINEMLGGVMKSAGPAIAKAFSGILSAVMSLLPAIIPLAAEFAKLLAFVAPVASAFASFLKFIAPVAPEIAKTIGVMVALGLAFRVLTAIMNTNPFVAILTALVFLVMLVIKHWDTIKAALLAAWTWIKETAATVWEAIKEAVLTPIRVLVAVVTAIWNAYMAYLSFLWNAIKTVAAAAWEAIKATVITPIRALIALGQFLFETFKSALSMIWNAIRAAAAAVWNAIKTAIVTPIQEAWNRAKAAADGMRDALVGAWNSIKSGISAAVDAVIGFFSRLWSKAQEYVAKIKSAIASLPFVPGSPIPMVVWAKQTMDGIAKAFDGMAPIVAGATGMLAGAGVGDAVSAIARTGRAAAVPTGGSPVVIYLTVQGNVSTERDLIDAVQSGLLKKQLRSGSLGLS